MSDQDDVLIQNTLTSSRILTEKIGNLKTKNGQTISEYFDVDGINIWTALEPYIALYLIPQELSKNLNPNLNNKLRPHLSLAKSRVFNFFKKIKGLFVPTNYIDANFISFGFSEYMYRDVLKKVTENINQTNFFKGIVLTDNFKNTPIKNARRISIWSFWNIKSFISSFILRKRLKVSLNMLKKEIYQCRALEDMHPEIDLDYTFNWIINFHAPLMIDNIVLANNLVKIINPLFFLCPDSANPISRIYSLSGKKIQSKTLEVQFAKFGQESIELSFSLADKIFVWGESSKNIYHFHGIERERLIVSGSPRHEIIKDNDVAKLKIFKLKNNIEDHKKILLIASTAQQKEYDNISSPNLLLNMQKSIFNKFSCMKKFHLVVKPHPLEDISKTLHFFKNKSNITLIDCSEDIAPLISLCDVFLSFGSTSTFDALVADKLVICPEFDDWQWSKWLTESKAILNPSSDSDVDELISDLDEIGINMLKEELSENRSKYLKEIIYENKIFPSDFIIETIKGITKEQ